MARAGYDFLHHLVLSEANPHKDAGVVKIAPTDTVELALKRMTENHVLSLPVIGADDKIVAMLDGTDILYFALGLMSDDVAALPTRAFALKPVAEIVDVSGRDPLVTVNGKDPVSMAATIMIGGVHRTPVVDENDKIEFCFSQSDVVKILAGSIDKGHLHPVGLKTLGELGLGQQGVISVGTEATVLSAMQKLQSNSISALAIVHENGSLAGNFSTSDLKGLYMEQDPALQNTVKDYLDKYHADSFVTFSGRAETTLATAIKEISAAGLHRMWVLDADNKPSGVVSLRDLIDAVLNTVV